MTHLSIPINRYYNSEATGDYLEEDRQAAEDALADVSNACDEAATQLEADGLYDASLELREEMGAKDLMTLRLAVSAGSIDRVGDSVEYVTFGGPLFMWMMGFQQELGMF